MDRRIVLRGLFSFRLVGLIIGAALLMSAGCAIDSEVVPVSGPHPATKVDQVKIYPDGPKRYEVLGVIVDPVTTDTKWDDRGKSDKGFERLLSKAAAMGANGLLLKAPDGQFDVLALVGYKSEYYHVPIKANPKSAVVQAIWVISEK